MVLCSLCAYFLFLPVLTTVDSFLVAPLSVPSLSFPRSLYLPSLPPSFSPIVCTFCKRDNCLQTHNDKYAKHTQTITTISNISLVYLCASLCMCKRVCACFLHIFTCNNLWNGNCLWHIISIMLPVRPSFILICLQSTHTHTHSHRKTLTHTPFTQPVSINCHLHKINIKTAGNNNNNKCWLNPSENF